MKMSFLNVDLRNKPNQNLYIPTYRDIAHYHTDLTKKMDMKDSLTEELLFNNIHTLPALLNKNLADTLVIQNQKPHMASSNVSKMVNNEYSKLFGVTSFISGVINIVSSVMFKRSRSPPDCFDNQMASPENLQYSKADYKNEIDLFVDESNYNLSVMSDCKTVGASYPDKLNKVRQLLQLRNLKQHSTTKLKQLTKQFDELDSVEDCFKDALSLEAYFGLPRTPYIDYSSLFLYREQEFHDIDPPKAKLENKLICESMAVSENLPKISVQYPEDHSEEEELNNKLVDSCEEKVLKLKTFLQNRRNKYTKVTLEVGIEDSTKLQSTKPIPITTTKDKRYKNPNRLCLKRLKTNMKQIIEDEMLFADEVEADDFSSAENSPTFPSLDMWSDSSSSNDMPREYFDEISGRFRTDPATSIEDSFQIVFSDVPKRVRSTSDCDSEDSFIIFEDSPDSCYTSNEVFSDSDSSDSDSDTSDSGCGTMKLSQSLSRTVSDLTDDSLYDEIDCMDMVANSVDLCKDEDLKSGLLLDEYNKTAKKDLPVKKVRFSSLPPKVHVMHVWTFAARQARAGHWERYARDSMRFQRRIADVDMALSWVLQPQHRSRIMFQRFMPWWNAEKRKELAEKKENEEKVKREAEEKEAKEKSAIGEIRDNVEKYLNVESVGQLEDKLHGNDTKYKSDVKNTNSFQVKQDSKNVTRNKSKRESTTQKRKKNRKTKLNKLIQQNDVNSHTKVENKLLQRKDRNENGNDIVRDADKRILKSNGSSDSNEGPRRNGEELQERKEANCDHDVETETQLYDSALNSCAIDQTEQVPELKIILQKI